MEQKVNVLDLFSGIGGFSLGLKRGGFEIGKHYFSEINPHSKACYQYHFPEAVDLGDITKLNSALINENIDIITFGSPCQDFSLAGNRRGLEGDRSSLIKEAMRLVRELQPSVFIWENVKGTFSSNARRDFWAILKAFTYLGSYRLEWQLLNTRWFLPQNRERIYLIGHLAGRSEPGVFPIGEEIIVDNQGATEKQIASCLQGAGGHIANGEYKGMNLVEIGTLRTYHNGKGFRKVKEEICPTIPARARTDGSGQPVIGAIRGRNPENPSNRESGIYLEQRLEVNKNNISNTLSSVQKDNVVVSPMNIRRLTEIECERLQGFPDNWTKLGKYGDEIKPISKTQRYGMLGNAVTVNVVSEVARRLLL